ncbi:hypothetical protein CICLE_v10012967mg [Citrus x clementina]|uniref:Uncharacterized protein n=2 Tax=Citrus clementina TaxID=85681 RepID=V4S5E8_CITCL|nr:uncharacterized protein LOC18038771 [Citrus x clementina]ESR42623.1 hypothetical protein CICLE_v10012967mg [Citrus x clementina]
MDVRDASGQRSLKLRWLRPDYSLSSGLCHGRCACMAGHQNLNKKYLFCGPEGRSHGSCPGSPLLSVVPVCVGVILRFCCLLLELTLSIHRICILNQPQLKITVPINQSTCSSRKEGKMVHLSPTIRNKEKTDCEQAQGFIGVQMFYIKLRNYCCCLLSKSLL